MSFGLAAFALIGISALFVLWPLWRGTGENLERAASAMAIFKDQLAEVDRDLARGLISDTEAQAARGEIKRRMLAADKDGGVRVTVGSGRWVVVALAALIPLGGAGLYSVVGQPGTPSVPFAERAQEQEDASELNTLITTLRERLAQEPDGGETRGWELLATTLMNQNRYDEAVEAWEKIVERPDATSATWSQYAEALIADENGVVTPKAEQAIAQSLSADPSNPAATFYRAIALDQAGQTIDGRVLLLERIQQEPREALWMEFYLQEINRMGAGFGLDPVGLPDFPEAAPARGPSAEDIEAASQMSAEEQQEFIRSMVDGLADRLKDEPGDLQGWLQLARSYAMLGERENALEALQAAQPLTAALPEDDPRRLTVEQGLAEMSQ